jgi:hypothetical protein
MGPRYGVSSYLFTLCDRMCMLVLVSREVDTMEAHYCLALAEELALRTFKTHCHLGLGKLYGRTGKRGAGPRARQHCGDDVRRDGTRACGWRRRRRSCDEHYVPCARTGGASGP